MKTSAIQTMPAQNQAVLIDVREPAEFFESHLPGAINLPATQFQIEDYRPFSHKTIYLICQSGSRAGEILAKLRQHHIQNVHVLPYQMDSLTVENQADFAGWSIDRQFRMTLGLLLAIFLLGFFFWSSVFIIIPLILCTGLIITSIIDRCYLRQGIAMLPWNKNCAENMAKYNSDLLVKAYLTR